MAFVTRAKLGSITDPIAGLFQSEGGGDEYSILATGGVVNIATKTIETTSSIDGSPVFEHNEYLYGQFVVRGYMVAGKALLIANLKSTTKNPPSVLKFSVDFGGGGIAPPGKLTMECVIEKVKISFSMTSPAVGVEISGRATKTDPAIASTP